MNSEASGEERETRPGGYLKASALIRQLPDPVQHQVHDLLSDGVMAPRVVIRRILLP